MCKTGKLYERNLINSNSITNNAIKANYVKAKIDNPEKNCKWSLYEERDGIINSILIKYNKLAQKEKRKQNWGRGREE